MEMDNRYIHFVQDIASEMPTNHLETVKGFLDGNERSLSFEICQLELQKRQRRRKKKQKTDSTDKGIEGKNGAEGAEGEGGGAEGRTSIE